MIRKILTLLIIGILGSSVVAHAPALAANTNAVRSGGTDAHISANWSGYVADTATYTSVDGSWTVPIPAASAVELATDATWVGIGGVKSSDLLQAGTQATLQNGRVVYQAWYELLPDYQHIVPLTVHGGDSVTVALNETSADHWHLSFINNTTDQDYEQDLVYRSSGSSAEWIVEMPVMQAGNALAYMPLDNFGTINFTGGYTVADGVHKTIREAGAQSVTMVTRSAQTLATPSVLADDSFSISRSGSATASVPSFASNDIGVGPQRSTGRHRHVLVVITFGQ